MPRLLSCLLLLLTLLPLPAGARDHTDCPARAAGLVDALLDRWVSRLAQGDPQAMAALYAPEAYLLPSRSDLPRRGRGAIADYFIQFLADRPVARLMTRDTTAACDELTVMGIYSFSFGAVPEPAAAATAEAVSRADDVARAEQVARARFTFVFGPDAAGDWLIRHHHSSQQPSSLELPLGHDPTLTAPGQPVTPPATTAPQQAGGA